MGFKYKLYEKKGDPRDESAPKKWYATPQSAAPLSGKAMTKAAAENTTLAPIELEAALDLLANFIPQQLLQGHTVTLPGLGYFRLTFKSKGADTVKEYDPKELITCAPSSCPPRSCATASAKASSLRTAASARTASTTPPAPTTTPPPARSPSPAPEAARTKRKAATSRWDER